MTTKNEHLKSLIGQLMYHDQEADTDLVDRIQQIIGYSNQVQTLYPADEAAYTKHLSEALRGAELTEAFLDVEHRTVLEEFLRDAPALVAANVFA